MDDLNLQKEKAEKVKSSLIKLRSNISQILKTSWDKMRGVKKKSDEERIKNLLKDIEQI